MPTAIVKPLPRVGVPKTDSLSFPRPTKCFVGLHVPAVFSPLLGWVFAVRFSTVSLLTASNSKERPVLRFLFVPAELGRTTLPILCSVAWRSSEVLTALDRRRRAEGALEATREEIRVWFSVAFLLQTSLSAFALPVRKTPSITSCACLMLFNCSVERTGWLTSTCSLSKSGSSSWLSSKGFSNISSPVASDISSFFLLSLFRRLAKRV
mmetsp:Transcript_5341/g.10211  ORF Transcript_5341/g.10211 Transcript_5341/m.10211 type:complete len:209 (-) Transcript_5341:256-882(-)